MSRAPRRKNGSEKPASPVFRWVLLDSYRFSEDHIDSASVEGRAPGPSRGPGCSKSGLFAGQRLSQLRPGARDIGLEDRPQRLRIRQNDAVCEELRAGRAAEGGLIGPALVEQRDLDTLLNGIELSLAHVPAD